MERLKDLYEAIQSVQNQTRKPDEIIVSVDHNIEMFNQLKSELSPSIKVVHNTNTPGLSETRNTGLYCTGGDIVVFIDDDAVADKDWLKNLTKHFCSPQVVAVGGRTIPIWPNGRRPTWFPEELDWTVGCTYKGLPLTPENEIRNVPGGNSAFKKQVFEQVGFFGTQLGKTGKTRGVAEESELCLRIKRQTPNALILYKSDAVIHHKVPSWRLDFRYLVLRSFNEGFFKSIVSKLSSLSQNPLSTENTYLRYLLLTSIPERLRQLYKLEALCQIVVLLLSIIATGTGYLVGKLKQAGQTTNEY